MFLTVLLALQDTTTSTSPESPDSWRRLASAEFPFGPLPLGPMIDAPMAGEYSLSSIGETPYICYRKYSFCGLDQCIELGRVVEGVQSSIFSLPVSGRSK